MKKSIVALVILVSSAASVFAPPFEVPRAPTLPRFPKFETLPTVRTFEPPSYSAAPSYSAEPSYSAAPSYSVAPSYSTSERAKVEEAKLQEAREAASERIFKYQNVTLTSTGRVLTWDNGELYSAGAFFSVQDEDAAIKCVSKVRAVVVAFLDYIRSIFSGDGSSANWSLDQIARGAHLDLRKRGFSDDDISIYYTNQFNETHVVRISRPQLEIMLASH